MSSSSRTFRCSSPDVCCSTREYPYDRTPRERTSRSRVGTCAPRETCRFHDFTCRNLRSDRFYWPVARVGLSFAHIFVLCIVSTARANKSGATRSQNRNLSALERLAGGTTRTPTAALCAHSRAESGVQRSLDVAPAARVRTT